MKMKDKIALMAALGAEAPSPAPPTEPARHAVSGAVKAFGLTVTAAEQEAARLREMLESGARIVDLDPATVDPAPLSDRMVDDDPAAFEALKASIAASGQEIPVLVRPHPTRPGRFELAYGHRRMRAVRELGRPLRAVVRPLSDAELVVAQGVENAERQDLSWIERARFAAAIEAAGHPRDVVMRALGIDKAHASRMLSVMRTVPPEIVAAIGRAPAVGWRRWQELAERMAEPDARRSAAAETTAAGFAELASDVRFASVLASVVGRKPFTSEVIPGVEDGAMIGTVKRSPRTVTITTDRRFGDWLAGRMGELHRLFQDEETSKE